MYIYQTQGQSERKCSRDEPTDVVGTKSLKISTVRTDVLDGSDIVPCVVPLYGSDGEMVEGRRGSPLLHPNTTIVCSSIN